MKIILKYELRLVDLQSVPIPCGAEVLHVGVQNGDIYVWCLCDPQQKNVPMKFFIYGTGHDIKEPDIKHVGTVFQRSFVWHIFMENKQCQK